MENEDGAKEQLINGLGEMRQQIANLGISETKRRRTEEQLKQSYERLRRLLEETANALASTVEVRDPYTAGHQRRATELACAIAGKIGFSKEQINGVRIATFIHDIGKIYVPVEILTMPRQLTDIEYSLIKTHPQVGYDVLKEVEFPWPVAQVVFQHHERINGSGYPQGLSGKDIFLEARIAGVADVVEAMASHRPYRPAPGIDKALEKITQEKGILYDFQVVDACLKVFIEEDFKFE